jgi:hypothetical protein
MLKIKSRSGSKSGSSKSGSRKSGSRKSGSRKSGSRKSGSSKSGSRKSGSSKSGSRKSGSSKSGSKTKRNNCFVVPVDASGFLTRDSLTENNLVDYVNVLLNKNDYLSILLDEQNMDNIARICSVMISNPLYLDTLVRDKELLDDDYFNRNVLSYLTTNAWNKLGQLIDYVSNYAEPLQYRPIKQSYMKDLRREISVGVGGAPGAPGTAGISNITTMVGTIISCVTFGMVDSGSSPIFPIKDSLFVTSVNMGPGERMSSLSMDERRAVMVFKSKLNPGFQLKICKFSCNIQDNAYDDSHLDPYKWEYYMYNELNKSSVAGGYNVESFTHCLQYNGLPASYQLGIPASITGGSDLVFNVSSMVEDRQRKFMMSSSTVKQSFKAFIMIGDYSTNHITLERYLEWTLGEIKETPTFDVEPYVNGLEKVINNIDAAFRQTGFVHCDAKVDNLLVEVNADGSVNRALIFDLDLSYFVDIGHLDTLIPLQSHVITISPDNTTITKTDVNYTEQRPACFRWWQNLPNDLYTPHLAHIFDSILMSISHFWSVIDYIHSPPRPANIDVINFFNKVGHRLINKAQSTNVNTTLRYFAVAWNIFASALNQQQFEDYSADSDAAKLRKNFDFNNRRFDKMTLNNLIRIFVNPTQYSPGVGVSSAQLLIANPREYKYFTVLPLNGGIYPLATSLESIRTVMRQHRDS